MRRLLTALVFVVSCAAPVDLPTPSAPDEPNERPDPDPDPDSLPTVAEPCASELSWFEAEVFRPVIAAECTVCHQRRGPASHTRLVLELSTGTADLTASWHALGRFAAEDHNGTPTLLARVSNRHVAGHGGGEVLSPGSTGYVALEAFVHEATDPACGRQVDACADPTYATATIHRLDAPAYLASIASVFGETATRANALAEVTSMTSLLADQIRENAETIAFAADLESLGPCAEDTTECRGRFIDRVGERLYRRPIESHERARYLELMAVAGADFDEAARWAITAMLQSPYFLYRSELGVRDGDVNRLTGHELATALAYMLTGTAPDEALRDAGRGGALQRPEQRARHARRLLASPAGRRHAARFFEDWLDLGRIATVPKDTSAYPINTSLRTAMREETERFVIDAFESGEPRLSSLLSESHSLVTPELAAFYGEAPVGPPRADGSVRVESPGRRFGLLTQGSLLTVHARSNDASPIHRGVLVRERLLCQELPSPPPGLQIDPPSTDPNLPTRDRYAAHAEQEPCRSCHRLIDPIGFGFNAYDGIGRFRSRDAGRPVDASGSIVDTLETNGEFADLAELSAMLAASPDVDRCFAETLQTWASGHPPSTCAFDEAYGAYVADDRRIDAFLVALAESDHLVVRTATVP